MSEVEARSRTSARNELRELFLSFLDIPRSGRIVGLHGDWRRKKPDLPFTLLLNTSFVLIVVIPLVILLQLPDNRLVLVCKL